MNEHWKIILKEVNIDARSGICELPDGCIIFESALHFVLNVRVFHCSLFVNDFFEIGDDPLKSPHIEDSSLFHGRLLTWDLNLLGLGVEVFHVNSGNVARFDDVHHIFSEVSINLILLKDSKLLNTLG